MNLNMVLDLVFLETTLHELISKWRNNLNNGLINLAMFVDFKKAFDM